ncbi:MAG: hypothetical protein CL844_03840 [Crocinitomicaceae bacterium]|nr:hypothetical protein [Crocinitomicaceae bacterium]
MPHGRFPIQRRARPLRIGRLRPDARRHGGRWRAAAAVRDAEREPVCHLRQRDRRGRGVRLGARAHGPELRAALHAHPARARRGARLGGAGAGGGLLHDRRARGARAPTLGRKRGGRPHAHRHGHARGLGRGAAHRAALVRALPTGHGRGRGGLNAHNFNTVTSSLAIGLNLAFCLPESILTVIEYGPPVSKCFTR